MVTDISDTPYFWYPIFLIPDIYYTQYLWYPIYLIPYISDIWIYSLCLTGATIMPRAPYINNLVKICFQWFLWSLINHPIGKVALCAIWHLWLRIIMLSTFYKSLNCLCGWLYNLCTCLFCDIMSTFLSLYGKTVQLGTTDSFG